MATNDVKKDLIQLRLSSFVNEIQRKKIIPVVGPELFEVELDGELVNLYSYISMEVAKQLDIEFEDGEEPPTSLKEVAYIFRQRYNGDPSEIYHEASVILKSREWPIPKSLLQLAAIDGFDLFLSVTPDDLITKALHQVRGDVQTISYAPNDLNDLPDAFVVGEKPTVFKLFGDINTYSDFVILDEDTVKFVNHLKERDTRPNNLFDVLRPRFLALLGCNFPNWLVQFFLYSTKSDNSISRDMIADEHTINDIEVLKFLIRKGARVFSSGNSLTFVNELSQEWQRRQGLENLSRSLTTKQEEIKGTVFLSYASEDYEYAMRIKKKLENESISVWMDKDALETGDMFERRIKKEIDECQIFIPVLSNSCFDEGHRFFRKEWYWAKQRSIGWPIGYQFIQPVIVDKTNPELFEEFNDYHFCITEKGQSCVNSVVRTLTRQKVRQ